MTWHAVYRTADGALVSQGTVIDEPLPYGLASKQYPDRPTGVWDAAQLDFVAVDPPPPVLTRLQMLRRFTRDERVAIRSSTDPVVQDFLSLLEAASEVDLGDTDTIAGVQYLEQQGLIAAGRAAEVLS